MGEALTTLREPTSAKMVHLGGPKTGTTTEEKQPTRTPAEAARVASTKAWRDNLTGAVYGDPAQCVNGCTQLVGEAAEKGVKDGYAPAPPNINPISPEDQTEREIARLEQAETDRKSREAETEKTAKSEGEKARSDAGETGRVADVKNQPQKANKARAKSATKKR